MSVVSIEREGRVAVVIVDNPPVNAISAEVRQGLWDAAETLDADEAVEAVGLGCAGRTRRRRRGRVRQAAGAAAPA